jgi:hypothetical protein
MYIRLPMVIVLWVVEEDRNLGGEHRQLEYSTRLAIFISPR